MPSDLEFSVFVPDCRAGRPATAGRVLSIRADQSFPIARRLMQTGLRQYETETLAAALSALEIMRARACDGEKVQFLDVGANIGVFSFSVAATFGNDVEVKAFEPFPGAVEVLRNVCHTNDLDVSVYDRAISTRSGHEELLLSAVSSNSHSLSYNEKKFSGDTLTVRTEPLHDFLCEGVEYQAVVKIDIEGSEPDVLEECRVDLERLRPWVIVEVLDDQAGRRLETLFGDLGYYFYYLPEFGSPIRKESGLGRSGAGRNWLLTPEIVSNDLLDDCERWRLGLEGSRLPQDPAKRGVRCEGIASETVSLEPGECEWFWIRNGNGLLHIWGNNVTYGGCIAYVMRKARSEARLLFGGEVLDVVTEDEAKVRQGKIRVAFPPGGWWSITNQTSRRADISFLLMSDV